MRGCTTLTACLFVICLPGQARADNGRAALSLVAVSSRCAVFVQNHELATPGSQGFFDVGASRWLVCVTGKPRRLPDQDALEAALKLDGALQSVDTVANPPQQACTQDWCIDAQHPAPDAHAKKGPGKLPLPGTLKAAGAFSAVLTLGDTFIAWSTLTDYFDSKDGPLYAQAVYRWTPPRGALEKLTVGP
jgi:hypothetical protein